MLCQWEAIDRLTVAETEADLAGQHLLFRQKSMMQASESIQILSDDQVDEDPIYHLNDSVFPGCASEVEFTIRVAKFAQSSGRLNAVHVNKLRQELVKKRAQYRLGD